MRIANDEATIESEMDEPDEIDAILAAGMPKARLEVLREARFASGDRVSHPAYGDGTVIKSTVSPTDEELVIKFDKQLGLKLLSGKVAPLTPSATASPLTAEEMAGYANHEDEPDVDQEPEPKGSGWKFTGIVDGKKQFKRMDGAEPEQVNPRLPRRFAGVPKEITLNRDLTWRAKAVAMALASLIQTSNNPTLKATLTDVELAAVMGSDVGPRAARTGRVELAKAGLLESTPAGHAGNVLRFPAKLYLPDA